MDLKDKRILALLDENSRIPITKLAKKVALSRQVVEYRIKKLVDDRIILNFVTLIDPTKFFDNTWHVYVKLQNMTEKSEKELHDYLNRKKEIWWIAKCQGEFDLIFSISGDDIFAFDKIMSEFRNNFHKYVNQEIITSLIEVKSFPRGYLSGKSTTMYDYVGLRRSAKIDNKDLRILRILANDSRMPSTEIAFKSNLTSRQVIYRIKELERKEVIRHYKLHLNFRIMNNDFYKVCFYTQNFTDKSKKSILQWCKLNQNVIFFVRKISPWTFEIEFETKDFKQLNDILKEMRNKFGEVIKRTEITSITDQSKGELNILDLY